MLPDEPRSHAFLCDGKTWTVALQMAASTCKTGLRFCHTDETRFLAFTRGALPSDRELDAMSEEVLCTLLRRAVAAPAGSATA